MRLGLFGVLAALVAIGLGLVFAGSADKLAKGTRVAGVDVGGLTPAAAQRLLEARAAKLATVPVAFTAGGKTFHLTPRRLGVEVDWMSRLAWARAGVQCWLW